MANINIFGTLYNAAGSAIVKGEQVEGGYAVVADVAARNAIPLSILKVGSLVYCQSDGKVYKCSAISGDVVTWVEFETPVPTKLSELENDMKFVSVAEPINVEGYKQLAYIECTGTQVIDTGFMPNQNTGFELDYTTYVAPTATNSPQVMNAGGRGTNPRLAVSLWVKNNLSGEVMVNTTSSTAKMVANSRSLLKYINDGTTKKITYTDNSTLNLSNVSDFDVNDSLVLFGLKSGATFDRYFRGRLYNLKLYNLTTLIHNFVPAMRLSDNEVGLLDVADNNTFYTNDGTGTFGYSEEPILNSVSQLIMDRNIVTDNNFTDVYRDQIQQNTDDIADIQALIPTLAGLNLEVVQQLPTQDISTSTIYLVPKSQSGTNNIYDEYIYVNNAWEKIGDTELDLSNYIQKSQSATGLLKDDGTVDTTSYQEELIGTETQGQNIKTINGTSILGTGNIVIQGGGSEYDIDALNSYLIVYDGDDSYFVPITKLTKPNTPTISTTTVNVVTGDGSFNVTTDSGSTAYYKIADTVEGLDQATYAAVSGGKITFASGFSNSQDNTDTVKYVMLKAIKNGVTSDESNAITLTIHPKVAKPSLVTNNSDKYASSATVVISKSATVNATTEYSEDSGSTWTTLSDNSITITVNENKATGTYKVRATKTDYANSDTAQSTAITLNKPYSYYGITNATISATVVANLTRIAEEKSEWKVGNDYIKSLSYTATAEHAVFAYPKEYGALTHILDPNGYENISGWSQSEVTIGSVDYYVYRTDDALTCSGFVYRFYF